MIIIVGVVSLGTISSITAKGEDGPANGTTALASDSTTEVSYTPSANFYGKDSFSYILSDGNGGADAVTVAVAVVNNAPVATDDTVSVVEDATATDVDVIWNDTDADGDTLFVSAVSQPSKGTAAIAEGGTTQVTYTPNADTSGSDWFTYEVSDGNGGKDTGTVTVTVSSVNDAPTIDAGDGPVSLTVDENTESGVDLGQAFVASDIDDAADELTYSLEGPDADSFELDASTGQLKTKAALDFETQSSYRVVVRVTDSGGGAGKEEDALSDTITVEIAVTVAVAVVNNAPVATDDTVSVVEDATATDVDVTWNDTDADGDTLFVSAVSQPSKGTAAIAEGGTTQVTYTPNADTSGSDWFTYEVSDGNGGKDTGTVTVTVSSVNDAPTIDAGDGPVSLIVDENTESGVDLGQAFVASDIDDAADELTYSLEGPDADSFELDASTGQLKTKAALDFETQSSYRVVVRVTDSGGGAGKEEDALSDTITVEIAVTVAVAVVNNAPVATDDTVSVVEDATATDVDVTWNDTDEDGDTLSVSEVGQAQQGRQPPSREDSTTKVSYTPNADFYGDDSFSYTVSDDSGGTDTGTVTVTVSSVNDAPTIDAGDGPVSLTVDENTESGVDLGEAFVASDIDDAADELTYSLEGPDADSFELDASTGQLKTKAALDFETQSSYRVVVRVTDSGGGAGKEEDALSDTITVDIAVTVTVAVAVVNNAPVATDDTVSVVEDATATDVDVTWNDTDADGDTLFVSAVSQPSQRRHRHRAGQHDEGQLHARRGIPWRGLVQLHRLRRQRRHGHRHRDRHGELSQRRTDD